jgi:hypothetical protein
VKRNLPAVKKALQFGISGAVGGFAGNLITEPFMQFDRISGSASFFDSVLSTARWFGLVGGGIAAAIMFGYYYYVKGKPHIKQALKNGGLFGLISGAISGAIAESIYTGIGPNELLRVICWGIAGSLLGLALSKRLPNLGKLRGLGGGAAGGVLGGCLFILFAYNLSGTVGRLAGCAAIGFAIGMMLIVAETLFNKAWLVISYDSGTNRTLSIGAEPVTFGSDENLSIVFIPNVSPLAAIFQLEGDRIACENVDNGTVNYLRSGDQKRIGNCTVTVGNSDVPVANSSNSSNVANFSNVLPAARSHKFAATATAKRQCYLKLEKRVIPLIAGSQLFSSDIPSLSAAGLNDVVAVVNSQLQGEFELGLTNWSDRPWWVTDTEGEMKLVEPENTLTLALGMTIEFGEIEGEIVAS